MEPLFSFYVKISILGKLTDKNYDNWPQIQLHSPIKLP